MQVTAWLRTAAIIVTMACVSTSSWAVAMSDKDTTVNGPNEAADDNNGCTSAGTFSTKLLSGMCWDCVLPIIVGAKTLATSLGQNKWSAGVPEDAASASLGGAMCMCYDNNGVPSIGIRTSLWEPFRLAELERQSGCSSVLNGIRFPFDKLNYGVDNTHWASRTEDHPTLTKKHYHYYSFPLMTMLDMWLPRNCNPGFYMDLDVMYLSEIDPTWNYDEIAFFTHPEAALIASPFGAIACLPDAFMSQISKPIKMLYWCAGSWGVMFPTTGHTTYNRDTLESTSLMVARILYALHRRGMEYKTMGRDAMCGGSLAPYLPKNQYRFSMFHPVPETEKNHGFGDNQLLWGIGRLFPVAGEDPVYVVWRWLDCCNTSTGA